MQKYKAGFNKEEILKAITIMSAIIKEEFAMAVTSQRSTHADGEFDSENDALIKEGLNRIGIIIETSRVINKCMTVESFLAHIKKDLY